VTPLAPERSLPNSVYYSDPAALAAAYEDLARAYDEAGVNAWTVWVPDEDRGTAALLGTQGHVLDAAPRAMALWLADLADGPRQARGVTRAEAGQEVATALNDIAYGYDGRPFATWLAEATVPPLRWGFAAVGGEPVACVGTIDEGDDCVVTLVATHPDHRGRGIAGWLLRDELARARERGAASASLQATKLGAGVYERLGFRDLGFIEMWERRRDA
jgi:ribosomal protein S18 acetylase RimI-like enzyme